VGVALSVVSYVLLLFANVWFVRSLDYFVICSSSCCVCTSRSLFCCSFIVGDLLEWLEWDLVIAMVVMVIVFWVWWRELIVNVVCCRSLICTGRFWWGRIIVGHLNKEVVKLVWFDRVVVVVREIVVQADSRGLVITVILVVVDVMIGTPLDNEIMSLD
jgi:hypothetical protein